MKFGFVCPRLLLMDLGRVGSGSALLMCCLHVGCSGGVLFAIRMHCNNHTNRDGVDDMYGAGFGSLIIIVGCYNMIFGGVFLLYAFGVFEVLIGIV